ncbi:MAG: M20/M25/M40 family metallo-hydrolase, partial [Candidatus Bathyarchaeota archaeon]|nr:M20/M25/M40 family metallo-hydrolase [Candidatus Bathyarchaeota archaeon]
MGKFKLVNVDEVKQTLKKLILIPSVSGSEHEIADYVEEKLLAYGFNVERISVKGCGPTIFACYKTNHEGLNLLFYGHLDTVKPVEGWAFSPFKPKIVGGKMYGLGSCDMKGGLAAILEALKKLTNLEKLYGNIFVALTSDEELYSRGCDKLISLGKLKGIDAAISAEPTGVLRMEVGRFGRVVYDIIVKGRSSRITSLKKGVDAVVEASKIVLSLKKLGGFNVLAINGGTEFLSTPDTCRIVVDKQLGLKESKEVFLMNIKNLTKKLKLKSNVTVKVFKRPTPYMKPYMLGSSGNRIIKAVEKACKVVKGRSPKKVVGKCVGDENYLVVRARIPAVTIGPKGGNEHSANEYVYI